VATKTKGRRAKPVKKSAKKKPVVPKAKAPKQTKKPAVIKKKTPVAIAPLDLSKFPNESVTRSERWICLACVWEVFTRHLGLAPRTAQLEIKRYTPAIEELTTSAALSRPYFMPAEAKSACPYCGSASKWHARMPVYRIESGKATDILRRELVKSLPKSENQFVVLEQKATQQHAFFEWLEKISAQLNLDDPRSLGDISRHYLSRKEPKVDWLAQFEGVHSIRRSRRLESGWEVDADACFYLQFCLMSYYWSSIW
jgi:hypothetical protein